MVSVLILLVLGGVCQEGWPGCSFPTSAHAARREKGSSALPRACLEAALLFLALAGSVALLIPGDAQAWVLLQPRQQEREFCYVNYSVSGAASNGRGNKTK